jgi:hypothetical protein
MTALLQFNEQSIHFRLDRFTSVVILPKFVELRYFVLLQQLQEMMIHVGLGGFEQLGGGVGVDHLDQLLLVELFLPVVDQNVENLLFPLVPVLDVELDLIFWTLQHNKTINMLWTTLSTDNKLELETYMDDVAVAGVHHRRFQIGNVTQRVHVVVQILEDRRSLPQDAVAAEYRVLLDQVEHYVVGGVSGGVNHADCGALYCEFLTVLQKFDGTTVGDVLPFAPRVLPHLGVLFETYNQPPQPLHTDRNLLVFSLMSRTSGRPPMWSWCQCEMKIWARSISSCFKTLIKWLMY